MNLRSLTRNIKQLRGLEHAGLILINFTEVLVQLLELLLIN